MLIIADFCHFLMLFQIIFVILCPKYDNLKQGKFIIPTFKQIRWLKQRKTYYP